MAWQNPYVPTFLHCARPRASPPPSDDGPSKPNPPTKPPAQSIKPASGKGRAMGPWAAAVRAGVAFKLAVAYALYVRHTATYAPFPIPGRHGCGVFQQKGRTEMSCLDLNIRAYQGGRP